MAEEGKGYWWIVLIVYDFLFFFFSFQGRRGGSVVNSGAELLSLETHLIPVVVRLNKGECRL